MEEQQDNTQNQLPQLSSYDDIGFDEIKPYLLDAKEDYPEPYYMLEFNGVPFSTIGGIQAITGQKKNGKTFVLAQLMAAVLAPDSPKVHDNLPGLTVPERTLEHLGHLPKVLYVDTEMEKLNSAKVLRRVHWLCGWDMKQPNDRLNVLWMRTVEATQQEPAYQKRWRIIKLAIDILKPDIVFIDGVRDIIGDFNDNAQSSALVQELMALAERKGICIWNVLHLNPRPGNDDESKMRGHLGTELGNKVTDTIASVKHKDGNGVTFTVKQLDARGKDLDDWKFEVTDQAGALGIPRIIAGGSLLTQAIENIERDKIMMEQETVRILKTIILPPKTEYFTNLIKTLKKQLNVGENKAKGYFNALRDSYPALLYQTNGGQWTLNKKELDAYEQGLPFASEP